MKQSKDELIERLSLLQDRMSNCNDRSELKKLEKIEKKLTRQLDKMREQYV